MWEELTACTSECMLALRNNSVTQGCGHFQPDDSTASAHI
ncbi:hypothetical protein APTSU1_000588400 [Apodemus speciosus]|uniref:Uncharacterized protein n=1 Tax=Apodemus speciosus TaxID=105296 RepID=A0ABQ0EUE1_APOSI